MWGGLALVVMKPEKRSEDIEINECQKNLYNSIYWQSVHVITDRIQFLKPYIKLLKNKFLN
jgi:hypothetical protein